MIACMLGGSVHGRARKKRSDEPTAPRNPTKGASERTGRHSPGRGACGRSASVASRAYRPRLVVLRKRNPCSRMVSSCQRAGRWSARSMLSSFSPWLKENSSAWAHCPAEPICQGSGRAAGMSTGCRPDFSGRIAGTGLVAAGWGVAGLPSGQLLESNIWGRHSDRAFTPCSGENPARWPYFPPFFFACFPAT